MDNIRRTNRMNDIKFYTPSHGKKLHESIQTKMYNIEEQNYACGAVALHYEDVQSLEKYLETFLVASAPDQPMTLFGMDIIMNDWVEKGEPIIIREKSVKDLVNH